MSSVPRAGGCGKIDSNQYERNKATTMMKIATTTSSAASPSSHRLRYSNSSGVNIDNNNNDNNCGGTSKDRLEMLSSSLSIAKNKNNNATNDNRRKWGHPAGPSSHTRHPARAGSSFLYILWPAGVAILLACWNLDQTRVIRRMDIMADGNHDQHASHLIYLHHHHQGSSSYFLFPKMSGHGEGVHPTHLVAEQDDEPNYRGLKIHPLMADQSSRSIAKNDLMLYNKMRKDTLIHMDNNVTDEDVDDADPRRYEPYDEQEYPSKDGCYRLKYTYNIAARGSCNEFHSITMDRPVGSEQAFGVRYLGR